MVLNVHRSHEAYQLRTVRRGGEVWREVGGGGGQEGDYIPISGCLVTTGMTSALRWAPMSAILMFHLL